MFVSPSGRDVALYALAVGASQEDACDVVDLSYTFNNQLDDTFVVRGSADFIHTF